MAKACSEEPKAQESVLAVRDPASSGESGEGESPGWSPPGWSNHTRGQQQDLGEQLPRAMLDANGRSRDDSNVEAVVLGSRAGSGGAGDATLPLFTQVRPMKGGTLVLDAAAKADGHIGHPPVILTLPVST